MSVKTSIIGCEFLFQEQEGFLLFSPYNFKVHCINQRGERKCQR